MRSWDSRLFRFSTHVYCSQRLNDPCGCVILFNTNSSSQGIWSSAQANKLLLVLPSSVDPWCSRKEVYPSEKLTIHYGALKRPFTIDTAVLEKRPKLTARHKRDLLLCFMCMSAVQKEVIAGCIDGPIPKGFHPFITFAFTISTPRQGPVNVTVNPTSPVVWQCVKRLML